MIRFDLVSTLAVFITFELWVQEFEYASTINAIQFQNHDETLPSMFFPPKFEFSIILHERGY